MFKFAHVPDHPGTFHIHTGADAFHFLGEFSACYSESDTKLGKTLTTGIMYDYIKLADKVCGRAEGREMNKYQALCNLRSLLRTMERDLGLDDLSSTELDIFLAAQSLGGKCDDVITTTELRAHELVASFPPATYHRGLRALVERGYLNKAKGAKAKSYVLAQT